MSCYLSIVQFIKCLENFIQKYIFFSNTNLDRSKFQNNRINIEYLLNKSKCKYLENIFVGEKCVGLKDFTFHLATFKCTCRNLHLNW